LPQHRRDESAESVRPVVAAAECWRRSISPSGRTKIVRTLVTILLQWLSFVSVTLQHYRCYVRARIVKRSGRMNRWLVHSSHGVEPKRQHGTAPRPGFESARRRACGQARLVNLGSQNRVYPFPLSEPHLEAHLYWHESVENDPANRWLRDEIERTLAAEPRAQRNSGRERRALKRPEVRSARLI
jgi:hypothetical protein